jgi:hypothetical protein
MEQWRALPAAAIITASTPEKKQSFHNFSDT